MRLFDKQIFTAVLVAVTLLVSCGKDDDKTTIPVTSVSLDQHSLTLVKGETSTIVATIIPENATNKTITWISDNAAVATIEHGKVTAIGVGTANISVTTLDGNKKDACVVTVTD